MSGGETEPEQECWLAQGPAVASGRLAELVAADPKVQELRRLAPDLVLLLATAETTARLQAACGDDLVVEKDEPLALPQG